MVANIDYAAISPEAMGRVSDTAVGPIRMVGIIDLDNALAKTTPDYSSLEYEETGKFILAWCHFHRATYYARPRESFSEREAAELTNRAGNSIAILEDMS